MSAHQRVAEGVRRRLLPVTVVLTSGAVLAAVVVVAVAASVPFAPAASANHSEPTVQLVAGKAGPAGFSPDGGADEAVFDSPGCIGRSPMGSRLYVVEKNLVRQINLIEKTVRKFVDIHEPRCISVDGHGSVHVSHYADVDRTAARQAMEAHPDSTARHANGPDEIVRYGIDGSELSKVTGLYKPFGIAWDATGTMWVADFWVDGNPTEAIRLSKIQGGTRTTVWAGYAVCTLTGGCVPDSGGLTWGKNGLMYMNIEGTVHAIDTTTVQLTTPVSSTTTEVKDSSGAAVKTASTGQMFTSPDNTKLYLINDNRSVRELTTGGDRVAESHRWFGTDGAGSTPNLLPDPWHYYYNPNGSGIPERVFGIGLSPDGTRLFAAIGNANPPNPNLANWNIQVRNSIAPGDPGKPWEAEGIRENQHYNGDPVNTATGNYVEPRNFLSFPSWVKGLDWGATYNSIDDHIGSLGVGWANDFDVFVTPRRTLDPANGNVTLRDRGGAWLTFTNTGANSWRSPQLTFGTLSYANSAFTLTHRNGDTWTFDTNGRLATITSSDGHRVELTRTTAGVLQKATHKRNGVASGYFIDFLDTAPANGLIDQAMASDGRRVTFGYGAQSFMTSWTEPYLVGETEYPVHTMAPQVGIIGTPFPGEIRIKKANDPGAGSLELLMKFDGRGRVTEQTTPTGDVLTYTYDTAGGGTTVSNVGSGEMIRAVPRADGLKGTVYDSLNSTSKAKGSTSDWYTGAAGQAATGQLKTSADRTNVPTGYFYDPYGRLRQVAQADPVTGTLPMPDGPTACDRNANGSYPVPNQGNCAGWNYTITNYTYVGDPAGVDNSNWTDNASTDTRVRSVTDADGVTTTYDYDGLTARSPVRTTVGTGSGALVTYTALAAGTFEPVASQDGDGVTTCRYLKATTGQLDSEVKILVATTAPVTPSTPVANISSTLTATCDPYKPNPDGTYPVSNNVGRTSYKYNALGQVTEKRTPEIQDPANQPWKYDYYGNGWLKTETDPLGYKKIYTYTATGEQSKTQDQGPNDPTPRLLSETVRAVDQPAGVCGTAGAGCTTVTEIGPMDGQTIDTTVGPIDATTVSVYDKAGDLVETRVSATVKSAQACTDPATEAWCKPTTFYDYGPMGRLEKQTNPDGTVTQYRYDDNGRTTATIAGTDLNDAAATESTEYDKLGRVKKTTSRSDGPTSPATVTEHTYTKGGKNLATIVGPAPGNPGAPIVTENEYDTNTGQLRTTKLVRDDYADVNQPDGKARQSTTTSYTPGGRVSCVDTVVDVPASGTVTRRMQMTLYDDAGRARNRAVPRRSTTGTNPGIITSCGQRMTAVTNPANQRGYLVPDLAYWAVDATAYRRDDSIAVEQTMGQYHITTPANPWDALSTDVERQTRYEYDAAGRRTKVLTPGGYVSETCYTPRGEAYMTIDPAQHAVHTEFYDSPGLAKAVTDPTGMPANSTCASLPSFPTTKTKGTTTFTYDGRGNKLSASKWNEKIGTGQFVTERWAYTPNGELGSYTRPIDATTTLTDSFGSTIVDGRLATRWTQTGDAADQSLRRTTDTFDKAGRIQSSFSGSCPNSACSPAFPFDGVGRSYDFAGRLVSAVLYRSGPTAETIAYEYNTAGNITAVVYPDGKRVEAAWNLAGNRTQLKNADGAISRYTYDDGGRLTKTSVVVNGIPIPVTTNKAHYDSQLGVMTIGKTTFGTSTSYRSWNYRSTDGKLTSYTQDIDGMQALWDITAYWPDGRLMKIECETTNSPWCSSTGGTGNRTTNYAYDRAGQLLSATVTGAATGEVSKWAYTYGNQGTRLTQTVTTVGQATPATTTYTYNHANQLTAATGAGNGVGTYTYDRAGRRLVADRTVTGGNGAKQTTTYGARGLIDTITTERPGQTTELEVRKYDAEGRYHQFTTTGPATHNGTMYWDTTTGGIPEIIDLNIDGVARQYIFGPDRITNGTTYNSYDINGSNLTSPGNPATTGYSPYGESITPAPDHTFNYRDEFQDVGLVLLRARDYDPTTGTFTTRDPLQGVNGTAVVSNPYHYSDNDPINRVDPTGERPRDGNGFDGIRLDYQPSPTDRQGVNPAFTAVGLTGAATQLQAGAAPSLAPLALPAAIAIGIPAAAAALFNYVENHNEIDGMNYLVGKSAEAVQRGRRGRNGEIAYRVYGGCSGPLGASWTPIDPVMTYQYFRYFAGLPACNEGTHMIVASINDGTVVNEVRQALPLPDSDGRMNEGGLLEFMIYGAQIKVALGRMTVLKHFVVDPPFPHDKP